MERVHLAIQIRILIPALVIKFDDLLQSLEAPVVHIRRRTRDFTQARGFESPTVGLMMCDGVTAGIIADAQIMVEFIREVESGMTTEAVRLLAEKPKPAGLRRAQGVLIAGHFVLVEGGIARKDGALKGSQSLR